MDDHPPARKREPVDNNDSQGPYEDAAGTSVQATGQTGNGQASDGQAFEKDEDFWFNDGTVILVARNVEFRVYEGLLAALSPVFKEIFQADGHAVRSVCVGKEEAFPCAIVHVSDCPEDLRYLLRFCFSTRMERCAILTRSICTGSHG